MRCFNLIDPAEIAHEEVPAGSVLVLGGFDGVHRGHRALFDAALALAKEADPASPRPVVCWSLSGLHRACLTTEDEKRAFFRRLGASACVFEDFAAIRSLSGEDFFRQILVKRFRPYAVVCGFNFTFGRGAACKPDDLCRLAEEYGIRAVVCPPVTDGGEVISSTRIRALIAEGQMHEAARLMGHPYPVMADVRSGHRIGRTIGWPTLNQRLPDGKLAPPRGVYASLSLLIPENGGLPLCLTPSVSNLGSRPTVNEDGDDVTLETHLLHADAPGVLPALEGQLRLVVWLGEFLRPERKFASLDELKAAIAADAEAAWGPISRMEGLDPAVPAPWTEDELLL
ncbi:MAG: hypothetical protein IK132_13760 [Clostridia bacterium]|nr:hypothetical protein [Clostridia bacterium]